MSFSALALLLALVASGASLGMLGVLHRRNRRQLEVVARLRDFRAEKELAPLRRPAPTGLQRWVEDLQWSAGMAPAPWHAWAFAGALPPAAALGALIHGLAGAVFYPLLFAGVTYGWLLRKAAGRRELMVQQLPGFIDHLIRAVAAGNTLDSAITVAAAEAHEPLRGAFQRVAREIQLGGALEEALEQSARTYDLLELRILKLAVTVNRRYGSSIQDLLKSVVTMIRRAEAARREFRALTGETRLSAWVLGIIPFAIAGYIVLTSPDYIGVLWRDPTGRVMLWSALGLQATGVFTLWRMVRSV